MLSSCRHLAPVDPLRRAPGALPRAPRPLLRPGLGAAAVCVNHLLDGLGVVVVDGGVVLLPQHVLVDDVYPGVDPPHVRVQVQQLLTLHPAPLISRVQSLHQHLCNYRHKISSEI